MDVSVNGDAAVSQTKKNRLVPSNSFSGKVLADATHSQASQLVTKAIPTTSLLFLLYTSTEG